ncbi:MAG TPA: IS1595 family transposase [Vicinamibacterales bacterium]|nr:IS1595 family transposase [Vicinamibacterales bacterium]
MDAPTTLQQAIIYFSDAKRCNAFMTAIRWVDGKVRCPHCDSTHVVYMESVNRFKCYGKHPKSQFSLKVGTIFEDSPLGLDKWLTAVWLVVNCKNGISSYEMARDLGVTQKSAWFMNHRIRLALHEGSFAMASGEVEVDETFIGGKARNMHVAQRKRRITGTGGKDKTAVMGILERGGKVRTAVVPNRKKTALQAEVQKHIEAGAALYTDALLSYNGLEAKYAHQVIDHAVAYVDGKVHTNGLENYWSLLKRGLSGTYVSVEPFHLFRYLDEQAFRYNNRKDMQDTDRFTLALSQVVGKRLTYAEVSGKTHEPSSAD